jgi:hypothetical protein
MGLELLRFCFDAAEGRSEYVWSQHASSGTSEGNAGRTMGLFYYIVP